MVMVVGMATYGSGYGGKMFNFGYGAGAYSHMGGGYGVSAAAAYGGGTAHGHGNNNSSSGRGNVTIVQGQVDTILIRSYSLQPQEQAAMENVLPAKYEEGREEEKLHKKPEDFSDMVAENAKKRKRDKEGKKKKDFKF